LVRATYRHRAEHGTIQSVYLVLLLAAVAILGGVMVVAMGRGGEIAAFRRDRPVAFTPIRTPADIATLRFPIGLLGYQVRATADALTAMANLLAERDYEIATLRSELWRLGAGSAESAGDHDQPSDRGGRSEPSAGPASAGGEAGEQADIAGTDLASTDQTWRQ
jgi:hypothetical protein